MKKLICFFTIFVFWGITDSMAQGLHFGVKAGVLGNKANISGMRDQFKEESLTGFQVGPMLQYQTGFHGIALDFYIYELKKGVRQMVLYTTKRKYEDFAVKRLINQKINYIIQPVGNDKINLFFGRKECINAIRFLVNQPLNKLSPEQDFILGAMLGYDICVQCKRYCDRKV